MVAIYHSKLCQAILVGFRRQLKADGICKDSFVGMMEPPVSSPSGDSGDFRVAVDDAEDGGALYDTAGDGFKVAEGC